MRKTFAYGAAANQGAWPVQEDGFFADPGSGLFAIADGFGGRGAGDLAAKLALQEARNAPPADRSPREGGILSPVQAAHRDLMGEINKKLLLWNEKRPPAARGGCSFLVASIEKDGQVAVTGCGACAAILVREGVWIPVLSPQAAPRRGNVAPLFPSQALGLGRDLNPESRALNWGAGDLLLLFSSGLPWERDGFAAELNAQLTLRAPGSDLTAFVALAAEGPGGEPPPWNQTVLAVEALGV